MADYRNDKAYKEAKEAAYKAERERYSRERGIQDGIAEAKHHIQQESENGSVCGCAILFVIAILVLCWLFGF